MKNKILVSSVATLALLSFNLTAFADRGFKIDENLSNSIKLSWDKDEKASYYQLNYGTESNKKTFETEATENTNFEVKGLEAGKKYYFTLTGLDSSGTEVFKSEDLEVNTSGSEFETFALKKLEMVESSVLRLSFSKNIDSTKTDNFEFKIESVTDISDYLKVKSIKVVENDKKSIDVELDGTPTVGTDYKVIALAVYDEAGENIKFGVDAEGRFKYEEIKEKTSETKTETDKSVELNAAGPVEEPKKEEAKKTDVVKTEEPKKVLEGGSVKAEEVGKNVESVSKNKENLPQTWPEMIFILLLALLIPAGIYKFKN